MRSQCNIMIAFDEAFQQPAIQLFFDPMHAPTGAHRQRMAKHRAQEEDRRVRLERLRTENEEEVTKIRTEAADSLGKAEQAWESERNEMERDLTQKVWTAAHRERNRRLEDLNTGWFSLLKRGSPLCCGDEGMASSNNHFTGNQAPRPCTLSDLLLPASSCLRIPSQVGCQHGLSP